MTESKLVAYVERSADWWFVEVPAVPGLVTQARNLDGIPAMVVEAASLLDVQAAEEDVEVRLR